MPERGASSGLPECGMTIKFDEGDVRGEKVIVLGFASCEIDDCPLNKGDTPEVISGEVRLIDHINPLQAAKAVVYQAVELKQAEECIVR